MKRIKLLSVLLFLFAACITVNAQELATDTQIGFDKTAYYGYREQPVIVLSNADLNARADQKDEISITVKSTADPIGISVSLIEDAADSGVFKGSFYLDPLKSDDLKNELRIVNDDTITATYNDRINSVGYTCSSTWKASTDTVEFNRDTYSGLYSTATVIVKDKDLNISPTMLDKANVVITSDIDPRGLTLSLNETGLNTGIFSASFKFSTTVSNSNNGVLKIGTSSSITAAYTDLANSGITSNALVTAKATFKFTEAVLASSAENDSGEGNMLDIIIYEPDNNNPDTIDRITAKVGTGSNTDEMTVGLEETGKNTGEFRQTIYFTDKNNKDNLLTVVGTDKVNIKYVDRTVPHGGSKDIVKTIQWEYRSIFITLDKKSYVGYNTSAKVTLYNMDLNKDSDERESIEVDVITNQSQELELELKETKSNSGIFTGTLYFGRSSKKGNHMIKMTGEDSITVSYSGRRNKSEIEQCFADWSPHDGKLTLNRQVYSGKGAAVTVTLEDWDVAAKTSVKDEVAVAVKVPGTTKKRTITLTETRKDSGVFTETFYINGSSDKNQSIDLLPGDTLEVTYTDEDTTSGTEQIRTATAVWSGISKAELSLNQTIYKGYDTYMQISVKDPDYNRSTTVSESVEVLVKTSVNMNGTKYILRETGNDTGIFTASLKLSKDSPDYSSVKVSETDKITVIFINKNINVTADFTK